MDYLSNHERKKRGTDSFPLDLYNVNEGHPRYDMPYHWHKEVEFVLVHSGEFHASLDGTEYILTAGDALYVGSGVIHGGTPKDCVYDCIVFDRDTLLFQSEIVRKTIKDIEGRGRILPCFKDGSGLSNIYIKELFLSAARRDEGYEMGMMSALLGFYSQAIAEGRLALGEQDEQSEQKQIDGGILFDGKDTERRKIHEGIFLFFVKEEGQEQKEREKAIFMNVVKASRGERGVGGVKCRDEKRRFSRELVVCCQKQDGDHAECQRDRLPDL